MVGRRAPYVAKESRDLDGALRSGAPAVGAWRRWQPHVCGICCLAMALRTFHGSSPPVWELLREVRAAGGFRTDARGSLVGVFHHPLLQVARTHMLDGEVVSDLSVERLAATCSAGGVAIASLQLERVSAGLRGSHLVLVYAMSLRAILLHDPASAVRSPGAGVALRLADFERASNRRGVVLRAAA